MPPVRLELQQWGAQSVGRTSEYLAVVIEGYLGVSQQLLRVVPFPKDSPDKAMLLVKVLVV